MSDKPGSGGNGPASPWDAFGQQASQAWQDWLAQSNANAGAAAGGEWAERVRGGVEGYYGWLSQLGNPHSGSADGAAASGEAPADPLKAWLDALAQGDFKTLQNLLLQTPGLGNSREQQARQQALAAAWMEYLSASQAYDALLRRSQIRGAETLRERLDSFSARGASPETLRALYDEWVDSAEVAYMDAALSAEFSATYAAMVNAQVKLRELQQQQVESQLRYWGLPTRQDIEGLSERVESLRRELRQLQQQVADAAPSAAAKPDAAKPSTAGAKSVAPKASRKATSKPAAKSAKRSAES